MKVTIKYSNLIVFILASFSIAGLICLYSCDGGSEDGEQIEPPTANWPTFQSDEFGYTVKYPPFYFVGVGEDMGITVNGFWESEGNFQEGIPATISIIAENTDLDGLTLEQFVTNKIGEPISVIGEERGFLEVHEPGHGEGIFHHFIYNTNTNVLVDIQAATLNHKNDNEFINVLDSFEF